MFSSNVQQPKFGRGNAQSDWKCVCGQTNPRYLLQCSLCRTGREYGDNQKLQRKE